MNNHESEKYESSLPGARDPLPDVTGLFNRAGEGDWGHRRERLIELEGDR